MSQDATKQNTAATGGSIWDNDLPAGDSPPLPRWPLTLSAIAYGIWMLFLIGMMVMRLRHSA